MNKQGKYRSIPHPGGILRSEVLPGFQFRLADLYAHPDLREKLDDPVYNSFILLEYQAEHHRADVEQQRAEAADQYAKVERQRAEVERQRAEAERQERLRLAAMLKDLGIDPDTGQSER